MPATKLLPTNSPRQKFFCDAECRFLALSGHRQVPPHTSGYGSVADIRARAAGAVNDPIISALCSEATGFIERNPPGRGERGSVTGGEVMPFVFGSERTDDGLIQARDVISTGVSACSTLKRNSILRQSVLVVAVAAQPRVGFTGRKKRRGIP